MTSSRTGIGIDVHRLKKGGPIILGGVQIPHEYGLLGHSDGDVLLHAVIDGFLGAANMGDIGVHFPSDNPDYKGISSEILLETAFSLIVEKGWKPVFVDATIIAEKPRLAKFVPQMKIKIARAVNLTQEDVSIKATTTDGLGYIGRGEGIACHAVVTIQRLG
ncbi:MAG: 2-C-methyl-D-erythritol 2,4-cyclodiphosphate synthase [SAR202 cluster bacterium]|jgi:2-C-methyl-D-erythritol 2,4-cyclodiphosphate synthase|nr:MAG: 2-C-methyl-D-erythritol 2,4-cyclodiphosphate synthase [SAR202 cluster bacterium]KAA1303771.1 MAG: 2-C-methyl-D-erythritol 2,4-cyclodiphosphate synthase [SAR202 cluster bacterium]MEC7734023.1 2-C-methyl-D-erythritol 2,4-cyclodiphosphate synthase [Chloroflexota bacterium]MEE3345295.1 2-C-methyl-D-erythritol 2,4-cyclodiphosphate synthase [Chloroflexota bacterium]